MKNIYGLFINQIIHYFKNIAACIKAGEQELVGIPLKKTVEQRAGKCAADILYGNPMLECRLIVHKVGEHIINGKGKSVYLQGRNEQ